MEYVRAFAVGGAICVVGQLLIDLTKLTPARIMVAYVTGGVILGALGWYAPLVNFAGCGATVPLSGFGYLLSEGVKAAVKEKGILGVFTGGITAGAAGIAAAVFFSCLMAAIAGAALTALGVAWASVSSGTVQTPRRAPAATWTPRSSPPCPTRAAGPGSSWAGSTTAAGSAGPAGAASACAGT